MSSAKRKSRRNLSIDTTFIDGSTPDREFESQALNSSFIEMSSNLVLTQAQLSRQIFFEACTSDVSWRFMKTFEFPIQSPLNKKTYWSERTLAIFYMNLFALFQTIYQNLAKYGMNDLKIDVIDLCLVRVLGLFLISIPVICASGKNIISEVPKNL